MNEAETRAELIDPALKEAGWGVVNGSRVRREMRESTNQPGLRQPILLMPVRRIRPQIDDVVTPREAVGQRSGL